MGSSKENKKFMEVMVRFFLAIFFTTSICAFAETEYEVVELSDAEFDSLSVEAFYYYGDRSPDDSRWVLFVDHEEEAEQYPLIRTEQDGTPVSDLYVFADAEDIAWAPNSKSFAFADYDAFYYGGDQYLYVVEVYEGKHFHASLHDLIKGRDVGKRDKLIMHNLGWLAEDQGIFFSLEANFLGTSGDDMMDQHRIEELGEDFERDDPIPAGNFVLYFDQ